MSPNMKTELKALTKLIRFFGLTFFALWAIQQYIWMLWVVMG